MIIGENQQFICNSKPFCLCVGEPNEWDECDCFAVDANGEPCGDDGLASSAQEPVTCSMCEAQMVLIDIESGEEVKAA